MIADTISNKKLNPLLTELFIRCRNLNISIVFITQSYFKVPKDGRLNCIHFFVILNHWSGIDFEDFTKICKNSTAEPYFFS